MSIIQQHTAASLSDAWRTINIDALEEDSPVNFDTSTLHPPQPEIAEPEVRGLAGQVRQLLRGGDAEGALRGCLEMPVYNGPDAAKVWLPECWVRMGEERETARIGGILGWGERLGKLTLGTQDAHLQTITEVLQSIKASEMTPLLTRIYGTEGGSEALDVLMKYL